ncbi:MAG: hypothetical protein WCF33_22975 [Pseudonocardiaceae bacterium]
MILLVTVTAAMVGAPVRAAPLPNAPTLPVEQRYYAHGPWAVSTVKAFGCCDSSGATFDVWYPTNLGHNGFRHPIITWGNGTNAVPSQYSFLLSHLASWGFVVIASENTSTGTGQEILDAARWMVLQNDRASSLFYHALAPTRVGAIGHSQGASGVLNAMIKSDGLITTAVPIELPAQVYCFATPDRCADTHNLMGGAIFLVNGSADLVISPSTQLLPWQLTGLQSNSAYYQATPASVTKVWATLQGPAHNDVQGQPDCASANPPIDPPSSCVNGVYGYLGYPTAWMMDRLQDDNYAHQAFISGTGELFHETANWTNQTSSSRSFSQAPQALSRR